MSEKSEQILDQVLGAMSIIADAAIKASPTGDKTENATVVGIESPTLGAYWVSPNDTLKYLAYCDPEAATYKIKDKVRVSIPNGEYNSKKYIIGKQAQDTEESTKYVSPLDTIIFPNDTGWIDISFDNGMRAMSKLLNNNAYASQRTQPYTVNDQFNNREIYNVLAVKFDTKVSANLLEKKITSGEYQIICQMLFQNDTIPLECVISSKELMGNPQGFMVYTPQIFRFDIPSDKGKIKTIRFYLYQDNNFKYLDNNGEEQTLPYDKQDKNQRYQIGIRNIQINFGGDLGAAENKTLKIVPLGDQNYYLYGGNGDNNQRDINLQWYNISETGEYIGFSDGRAIQSNDSDINATVVDDEGKISQHYSELRYQELLAEEEELLTAKSENRPTNKLGLKIARDYDKSLETEQVLYEMMDELIDIAKGYQGLFSEGSGVNKQLANQIKAFQSTKVNLSTNIKNISEVINQGLINAQILQSAQLDPQGAKIEEPMDSENIFETLLNSFGTSMTAVVSFPSLSLVVKSCTTGDLTLKDNLLNSISQKRNEYNDFNFMWRSCYDRLRNIETNGFTKEEAQELVSSTSNDEFVKVNAGFYSLYWYKRVPEEKGDVLGGEGWQLLSSLQNTGLPSQAQSQIDKEKKETYLVTYGNNEYLKLPLDIVQQTTVFKAVLIYNHEIFTSDEIAFVNINNIEGAPGADDGSGLILKHIEPSRDAYTQYGQYRKLKDIGEAQVKRPIEVLYQSGALGNEVLHGSTVYWYFPASNTMLLPPTLEDLAELGLIKEKASDRAGYIKYKGTITYSSDNQNFEIQKADDKTIYTNQFVYYINSNYNSMASNNSIICKVVKDKATYEKAIPFSFFTSGTNGTPYSLIIEPYDNTRVAFCQEDSQHQLRVSLFNNKDEQVTLDVEKLVANVIFNTESIQIAATEQDGMSVILTVTKKTGANLSPYGIIEVSYDEQIVEENNKEERYYKLTELYALPYAYLPIYRLSGVERLNYQANGMLIDDELDKVPYKLFHRETGNKITHTPKLYYQDSKGIAATSLMGMPKLSKENILIGTSMYIDNPETYTVFVAVGTVGQVEDKSLWVQPIIIAQDTYSSPFLNEWSGALNINENNNTIMATMMGAGFKDSDNKFSGVLMGRVNDLTEIAPPGLDMMRTEGIGLYGFNKGQFSYGFNKDGTAFLGKSGGGRIWFDGNCALIASSNWFNSGGVINSDGTIKNEGIKDEQGNVIIAPTGMAIDLQNGYIDAYNFTLTAGSANDQDNPRVFFTSKASNTDEIFWGENTVNDVQFSINDQFISTSEGEIFVKKATFDQNITIADGIIQYSAKIEATPSTTDDTSTETPIRLFRANLYYSGKKVIAYSNNWDVDSSAWYNTEYTYTDNKEIRLSVAKDTEYFITSTKIDINTVDDKGSLYNIDWKQHGYLSGGQTKALSLSTTDGTPIYLILNSRYKTNTFSIVEKFDGWKLSSAGLQLGEYLLTAEKLGELLGS